MDLRVFSKDFENILSESYGRGLWQEYLDIAEGQRHTEMNRKIYKMRSETIEIRFGNVKEKHSMRDTKYRGLQKNIDYTMLRIVCMNLKMMAN